MNRELFVFLIMIACGAALSALFDLMRAALRAVKPPDTAVAVCDFLFWLAAGFIALAAVWNLNSGTFRFYEPVGLVLGSVFYFLLFSKWIFGCFLFIIENILKFVKLILKILLTPPLFLYKILIVPIKEKIKNNRRKGHDICDK